MGHGTGMRYHQELLAVTRHYHRCVRRVRDKAADRAEQHTREATASVVADHDQLCRFGGLQ